VVIAGFGLIGWALCEAVMFIGMGVTSLQTTLDIHAAGAPVIFATLSWIYFTRFGYTPPLATAVAFLAIVKAMDFFLVALVINKSLDMFTSPLGTWIPFGLIFLSTYLTGRSVQIRSAEMQRV
jgi:hypothetical protein